MLNEFFKQYSKFGGFNLGYLKRLFSNYTINCYVLNNLDFHYAFQPMTVWRIFFNSS